MIAFTQALWEFATALAAASAIAIAVAFWTAVGWAIAAWFKHWRLYNPHPIAKRIRRHLAQRRAAARARPAEGVA